METAPVLEGTLVGGAWELFLVFVLGEFLQISDSAKHFIQRELWALFVWIEWDFSINLLFKSLYSGFVSGVFLLFLRLS